MLPVHFLTDQNPLYGEDAVAAIITDQAGRYLLQLRDDIPRIFYPGHWACFGGAVGQDEGSLEAIKRELEEELEFRPRMLSEFVKFDFDLSNLGQKKCFRAFYEVSVTAEDISRFVLHEGADMRLFTATELFALSHVTPYDSFALWLHTARVRFRIG